MTLVRPAYGGLGRALCDYAPAAVAAFGTQIGDPIRVGHDVEIVFDHEMVVQVMIRAFLYECTAFA